MKLPSPFVPREKFLVLEIMPGGVNGLFMSVDDEHSLVIEKLARGMDLAKYFGRPWRRATQRAWEGEYLFKDRRRVIAVADPALATTVPIPVTLMREPSDAKLAITVPELENMISQEMAKIFNTCRTEASARLGAHELDAVLVGEKARDFRVDGNAAVNPAGFTGKKVTLLLELTFTRRDIFDMLAPFFNAPDEFYFAEAPQARLTALARVRKLPLGLIAAGDAEAETGRGASSPSVFVLEAHRAKGKEEYPVLYREPFSWNFAPVFARISAEFGVDGATARDLYAIHLRGGFSAHAARIFARAIDPIFEELLEEAARKKLQGTVFVDAPFTLPFAMPRRHGAVTFEDLPLREVLQSAGFPVIKGGTGLSDHVRARYLLPFIEAYFNKGNTEINQKLRRRLHWLAG